MKKLKYSSNPLDQNKIPLTYIDNGELLYGRNHVTGQMGNLNLPVVELQTNIDILDENINEVNEKSSKIEKFIGDFSEDEKTYGRHKNGWVSLNKDGILNSYSYFIAESNEVRDDRLVITPRITGNNTKNSSTSFTMVDPGVYNVNIDGTLTEPTSINPFEVAIYVNEVLVDRVKLDKTDTENVSRVSGFMTLEIRNKKDIIHLGLVSESGLMVDSARSSIKLSVFKIGDIYE